MTHRILILRLSALGDILHGLPVASALRRAFPEAHLGWLVEDRGAELLRGNPLLDRLHVLPRRLMKGDLRRRPVGTLRGPLRALVGELRGERYDVSIDLQGLTKSAWWGRLAGARQRIGFRGEDARELSRLFYTDAVRPPAERYHVIERNLSLLGPLGVVDPAIEFNFRLDPGAERRGRALWGEADAALPRVVVNVGAGWVTKQWPPAHFGRLAARLARECGACVAVAWGPGEEALAAAAMDAAREAGLADGRSDRSDPGGIEPRPGVYLMPMTTFLELGGVIAGARLYVGGDTGPTHMAGALGIPVVSMFGGSDARRNGPLGSPGEVIQLDEPECIPCWKTRCEWREPLACLTRLSVERVFDACRPLLS
jgi:heptosyltransferase I